MSKYIHYHTIHNNKSSKQYIELLAAPVLEFCQTAVITLKEGKAVLMPFDNRFSYTAEIKSGMATYQLNFDDEVIIESGFCWRSRKAKDVADKMGVSNCPPAPFLIDDIQLLITNITDWQAILTWCSAASLGIAFVLMEGDAQ